MGTSEVTGDEMRSKAVTDSYRENFEKIFGGSSETDKRANHGNSRGHESAERGTDNSQHKENGSTGE